MGIAYLFSFALSFAFFGIGKPPRGAEPPTINGRIMVVKRVVETREEKYATLTPDGNRVAETPLKQGFDLILTPDGKRLEIPFPKDVFLAEPCLAPDGKRVAFIANENRRGMDREFNFLRHIYVRSLEGKDEGSTFDIKAQNLAWTPDGKLLAVEASSMKDVRSRKFTTWLVDVGAKEKTKLEVPETAQIYAATPDGKSFIATTYDFDKKQFHIVSISRSDKKITQLTPLGFGIMTVPRFIRPQLSPDGSRILFLDVDKEEKLAKGATRFPRLYLYDLKANRRVRLAEVALDALIWEYAWAPDSKKVAYVWKRMEPGVPLANALDKNGKPIENPKRNTETETHLNVADADGKNSKTILSAKAPSGPTITMTNLSWR